MKRMREKTCPACGKGKLVETDTIISELEGYVFVERGERCVECGEEFPYEKEAQRTIEIARKLGVWPEPLKLYRKLSEAGRGIVLRIPADIERQLRLKAGKEVTISKIGKKIVIEPLGT